MFLLNMLLDLTDGLHVFSQSFATESTSASLHFILIYQIKFPPPHPGYQIYSFCLPLFIALPPPSPSIRHSRVE